MGEDFVAYFQARGNFLAARDFFVVVAVFFFEGNKEKVANGSSFVGNFHQNANGTSRIFWMPRAPAEHQPLVSSLRNKAKNSCLFWDSYGPEGGMTQPIML